MKHVSKKLVVLFAIGLQILAGRSLQAGSKEVINADAMSGTSVSTAADTAKNPFKDWYVEDVKAGPVDIHGFASQGYLYSPQHNFPTNQSSSGDARLTDLAINGSYNVLPNLRLALQVYAGQFGNRGEMVPDVDWGVIDYQYSSYIGLRAGRVKQPIGFYNESQDVDAARVFAFLPMGFYDPRFRTMLNSFDGGMFYGNIPVGKGGDLGNVDYTAFMGQKSIPPRSYLTDSFNSGSGFVNTGTGIFTDSRQDNYQTGFSLV